MAEFGGYVYRSVSTYSSTRNGMREPAVIKPFDPFVPKTNGSNYSEGAVTRKTIVPVTSRPYDEPVTEKYASSEDESDDDWHRQTSPYRSSPRKVDEWFPTKVQNHEASRNPQRFAPIVDRGHHSPQRTAEGRKPIGGSTINNHDGTYNGGSKDGRKPIGISPNRNDKYDGTNGYGGDRRAAAVGDPNPYKKGRKPIGISPIKKDNYDGTNVYGGDLRPTSLGVRLD